jgi:hypothetical protein
MSMLRYVAERPEEWHTESWFVPHDSASPYSAVFILALCVLLRSTSCDFVSFSTSQVDTE